MTLEMRNKEQGKVPGDSPFFCSLSSPLDSDTEIA